MQTSLLSLPFQAPKIHYQVNMGGSRKFGCPLFVKAMKYLHSSKRVAFPPSGMIY